MPRKKTRRVKRLLLNLLLILVLLSWLPVMALRWLPPPTTAFMLQQKNTPQVYYDWTSFAQLGANAPLAVIASEDQNFPGHFGFDTGAIQQAVLDKLDGKSLRGASTLSQQVAKNLFLWPGRQMSRKMLEAWFTLLIELSWPKQRILEMYLNIAEFGPGIYGVPAASQRYFGVAPEHLTDRQAALLAAVLPNPVKLRVEAPTPYVRERQAWILEQMQQLRSHQAIREITG